MKTTGKLLGAVYALSANKLMGLAVKVKERPEWCAKNIPDFPQVRAALEKVLDIREDDRERVYRYYHPQPLSAGAEQEAAAGGV